MNEASSEILCEVAPRRFSVGTAVRERRVRLHCTDQLVHRVFLEGSCGVAAASSLESLFIYFFFWVPCGLCRLIRRFFGVAWRNWSWAGLWLTFRRNDGCTGDEELFHDEQ